MRARVTHLLTRVDGLPMRTRALVLVTVLALLGLGWHALVFAPLDAARASYRDRVQDLDRETERLNGEIARLLAARTADPDADTRSLLEQQRARLARSDARLAALTRDLVPPGQMAGLLQAVLERNTRLELVSLEGLGPQPVPGLADPPPAQAAPEEPGAAAPLYRHGLRLVLRGSYLDVLAYLRELEALPWRLLWEGVELQVESHPTAAVTITVYSLSLDEAWIGV